MDSRRGWLMWLLGVFAYAVAILQRTSFGVAGIAAADRFHAGAGVVSTFMVVQLLTYALMQVPAGLLVDRFGTRLVVGTGALLMALGQLGLAHATALTPAIAARLLVGIGDACTFSSVLRLLPGWFSERRLPLLTQATGLLGGIGQLASSIPFAAVLRVRGWTTSFTGAAVAGAVASVAVYALLRNAAPGHGAGHQHERERARATIAAVVRQPGTWLGFWSHWMGFSGAMFALMWGYPWLQRGEGKSVAEVGTLFTIFVLVGLVTGPTLGVLTQRHPLRRSNLVLTVAGVQVACWLAVLTWPGPAPWGLLVALVIALAAGGSGTAIGFDFARTANPRHRIGTATGVVIMGTFVAAIIAIPLVGIILDTLGHGTFTRPVFRTAMATQFAFFAIGFVGILVSRRHTRARMRESGVVVPPWDVALRREWRRLHGR